MECMETDSELELGSYIQQAPALSNSKMINSLNADCWHLVLGYLSIHELMQSETTCKDWQKLVLDHISHRRIYINGFGGNEHDLLRFRSTSWPSFKRWVKKCGRSIWCFRPDCSCKDVVEVLRDHCPNLETLQLRGLKQKLSPTKTHHFLKLKELTFDSCDEVTDDCVSQFLTRDLEELRIVYNKRVTGRFLNNIKCDKLIELTLKHCRAFKFAFLLSAADRLTNLEELVFWKRNRSKIEIRNKLHLLLDKMPKLDKVNFVVHDLLTRYDTARLLAETNVFFESLCRHKNLVNIEANFEVWDQHLEALGKNCKHVAYVHLLCDHVTHHGLKSLRLHLGPNLYGLTLSRALITDDDVVALVLACPILISLDISDCPLLEAVVPRVAAARRGMRAHPTASAVLKHMPLGLVIGRWDLADDPEDFKDVIDLRYTRGGFSGRGRQY